MCVGGAGDSVARTSGCARTVSNAVVRRGQYEDV